MARTPWCRFDWTAASAHDRHRIVVYPSRRNAQSNLLTFPMAIISGLWWPITMLPNWLQVIGKQMPTYFVNKLLNQLTSRATVDLTNLVGIVVWFVLGSLLVVAMTKHEQRKGVALGEA